MKIEMFLLVCRPKINLSLQHQFIFKSAFKVLFNCFEKAIFKILRQSPVFILTGLATHK